MREQDREVVVQFRSLGIGPGLTFDAEALTAAQRRGLKRAAETAFARVPMHGQESGRMRNGWRFANNLGGYGDDRILASTIGLMGYGANLAEEALYPPAFYDHEGQPLYRLHDNQLKANPIDRCAIGDRTPGLKRNADGSIDLWVQQEEPDGDKAANWLPSGESGQIWMILRMYGPRQKALSGEYAPPVVERMR